MSHQIPTSLKAGPSTTNTLVMKSYLIVYFIILWLSVIPIVVLTINLLFYFEKNILFLILLIPLYFIVIYFVFFFSVVLWSWIFLRIVILLHYPKEGIFPRDRKNVDYKYWSLRAVIKKLPIWVAHNFPIPWCDNITMKVFGNQVSYTTPVYDGWIDMEFLDIGHGSIIGQGAVIMTSMLTVEFLIIKRVSIGRDCLVGAHAVVSPGTKMGDQVILGALSSTNFNQELESGFVYWGTPAQKIHESKFREEDELSSDERANLKETKVVERVVSDSSELKGRKGTKAMYQLSKSAITDKIATRLSAKSEYQRSLAHYKAIKYDIKADRQQMKSERARYSSVLAMEKAQQAIREKMEKHRDRLTKIEEREYEKELEKLEQIKLRENKKDLRKIRKEASQDPKNNEINKSDE